jgi:hypothetical protein
VFNWIRHWFDAATGKIDSVVASWVHAVIHGLYEFLSIIFSGVGDAWTELEHWVSGFAHEINLFADKIWRAFDDAYRWINHEGWLVYHYLSHPSLLVDLLWDHIIVKLEKEAWNVADRLGRFFASLFIRNLRHFLLLMEDILHAVL